MVHCALLLLLADVVIMNALSFEHYGVRERPGCIIITEESFGPALPVSGKTVAYRSFSVRKVRKRLVSILLGKVMALEDLRFVFVHGLSGWGSYDESYRRMPYWGMRSGDLMPFLKEKGFDSYAASVAPSGSAWDHTCELYAQLAGNTGQG